MLLHRSLSQRQSLDRGGAVLRVPQLQRHPVGKPVHCPPMHISQCTQPADTQRSTRQKRRVSAPPPPMHVSQCTQPSDTALPRAVSWGREMLPPPAPKRRRLEMPAEALAHRCQLHRRSRRSSQSPRSCCSRRPKTSWRPWKHSVCSSGLDSANSSAALSEPGLLVGTA